MRNPLVRSCLLFILCCLAFGAAYFATRAASGEAPPAHPAMTSGTSATPISESTSTPPFEATRAILSSFALIIIAVDVIFLSFPFPTRCTFSRRIRVGCVRRLRALRILVDSLS